ncbi:6391_t:CDS:1, partial [Dentiscutata heterogama]
IYDTRYSESTLSKGNKDVLPRFISCIISPGEPKSRDTKNEN